MAVRVGKTAPEIEAEAYVRGAPGPERFSLAGQRGTWVVLFFYPRDFTFICPTEIAAFAALEPDFIAEHALVVGASTDSYYSHKAWFESDPRLAHVSYRVLADTSHRASHDYGVLLEDGAALRGTFVIDPEGVVRHLSVNELDVGRNVEETLRVLRALKLGELCPVNWRPGEATLTHHDELLARAFPRLSEEILAETAKRAPTLQFDAGDTVVKQGEPADALYVVVDGQADVVRRDWDGGERVLAQLGPGEFFGEIGLLTESRRTASVRAATRLKLLALDRDSFRAAVEASDPTRADLAAIVRERLAGASAG